VLIGLKLVRRDATGTDVLCQVTVLGSPEKSPKAIHIRKHLFPLFVSPTTLSVEWPAARRPLTGSRTIPP
jgi:hypothetical protein